MNEKPEGIFLQPLSGIDESMELIGRLFEVATPDAVFSEPVEAGDFVVITASEAVVSMGAGFGGGGGYDSDDVDEETGRTAYGSGGGGGGGGLASSRPVAAITIGPGGATVEPIVDQTKLVIAFLTTFAAMIISLSQTLRFLRKQKL